MTMRFQTMFFAAALSLLFGTAASALPLVPSATASPEDAASGAYCVSTGGHVQTRIAAYGTNNPNPLYLAGVRQFCQYVAPDGGSQISLLLETLYTLKPTLAAIAYYAKVAPGSCQGNPASCYCSLLGGTDLFGGINAAGGGWVLQGNPGDVLDTCIFPDESSIDSFGLFYHSAGIIRGKNLAKVLRYQK
jgi:hypothetical protein